ncbi:MAG: RHS repeat-associated core domain-containing protein [Bacteroidia bacterium]
MITVTDYYPFGSAMPGRSLNLGDYRFGFQNQETDPEIYGTGNAVSYKYRVEDARLGRFLSVDPLSAEYPELSPYNFVANSPITFLDSDGRDIVYFNREGKEIYRVVTEIVHETYVLKKGIDASRIMGPILNSEDFSIAKMPNRIFNKTAYEKDRDYNKFDYQIAASTHLINESIGDGTALEKTEGAGRPDNVPELDPNLIKAMILTETQYGYIESTPEWKKGELDIMQVNVGSGSTTIRGDWDPKKQTIGLKKDIVPTPQESIHAGIQWLYFKGIQVTNIKYNNGVIVGGNIQWTGGEKWEAAAKAYNGSGDPKYSEKLTSALDALDNNSTTDYEKNK